MREELRTELELLSPVSPQSSSTKRDSKKGLSGPSVLKASDSGVRAEFASMRTAAVSPKLPPRYLPSSQVTRINAGSATYAQLCRFEQV
jgi:hypothetical protein